MTQFKPTLIIKRLVITRGTHRVYDEEFHSGVNVIRGENSSGKSTILNFIFYAIGGDLGDWSDVALLCNETWVEVEFNGTPATLRREIDSNTMKPMWVYGGRFEDAATAAIASWHKYPYRRSANVESFSQALFRLMGMPNVATEGSGNITIHQILRLLYADQLSPVDEIFKYESRDFEDIRENVGNLLSGAYTNDIYEFQQQLRKRENEFKAAAAELTSIVTVLSNNSDESIGLEWVNTQKKSLINERETLIANIATEESVFYEKEDADKLTLKAQNDAYSNVQELQVSLGRVKDEISELEFNIADADEFIRSLRYKIEAMRDAEVTATVVQHIQFGTCPACHAEVLEDDPNSASCSLCKTPFDRERAKERIVGLLNEAAIQLKQSTVLQARRKENLETAKRGLFAKQSAWKVAAKELEALQVLPTSESRETIRTLHRRLGYLDREIDDMEQKLKLASKLDELRLKKSSLNNQIIYLKDEIDLRRLKHTTQLTKSHKLIESEIKELLRNDLKRQDSFENPESIQFSFRKNQITVDDMTYFSASSRVVLKSSFYLGFLSAALRDPQFRHPRFLLLDTTEDKGMEPERSHNFQNQIMRISNASRVEHQIIFATAMPSSSLEQSMFVGEKSSRASGTLKLMT